MKEPSEEVIEVYKEIQHLIDKTYVHSDQMLLIADWIVARDRENKNLKYFKVYYVESDLTTFGTVIIRAIDKSEAKRLFIQTMNDESIRIRHIANVQDICIN